MKKTIVNITTSEVCEVDMTPEEEVQYLADLALAQAAGDAYQATVEVAESADGAVLETPNWSHWNKDTAYLWFYDNIQYRLDIAPTITSGNIIAVANGMLEVMRAMATMLWALAQIVIALRNKQWPNYQSDS